MNSINKNFCNVLGISVGIGTVCVATKYIIDSVIKKRRQFEINQNNIFLSDNITYKHSQQFITECSKGDIDSVIKLYNENRLKIRINYDNDAAFRQSCQFGHIHIARWLLSLHNNKINVNAYSDDAIRSACKNNDMQMIQWLLSLPKHKISKTIHSYALYQSCLYGSKEIAEWILSLTHFRYDNDYIIRRNNYLFSTSCYCGNINIAQWLLSLPDNHIDLDSNIHAIFRRCCKYHQQGYKNAEIIKWLLSLPNSNNINLEEVFLYSCYRIEIMTAKLLFNLAESQICNIIDNVFIKIVTEKYERYETIQFLILTGKLNNKIVNEYYDCIDNETLKKSLFNNCYYPLRLVKFSKMLKDYQVYRAQILLNYDLVINNDFFAAVLWKIVYDYVLCNMNDVVC